MPRAAKKQSPSKKQSSPSKFNRSPDRKKGGSIRDQKNSGRKFNRVYSTQMQNGITIVRSFKPAKEEASFTYPSEEIITEDEDVALRLGCDDILPARSLTGENRVQPSGPGSDYAHRQFVHVAKMNGFPDEEDTRENSEKFGTKIAEFLNTTGTSEKYQFTTRFRYCGDVTPFGNTLPPVAKYFLDSDVVNLVKFIYPSTPIQDIAEDDETVASFFGDHRIEEGRDLLLAQVEDANDANEHQDEKPVRRNRGNVLHDSDDDENA